MIRQLREERQMPQRKLAAALEIDTVTCCKIEKGEWRVKAEQVVIIADLLRADKDDLLALWLAEQVSAVVTDEQKMAEKAMKIAKTNIKI
jgi:DNA-binding XRE family transcriptional regulator